MIYDFEVDSGGSVPLKGVVEVARLLDVKDFGIVWKGEANNREVPVFLSAIAATTERIGLGTAVLNVLARSPVVTGMFTATLDELSGGRFTLGLGVGNRTLANWYGQGFGTPLKMIEEYVSIVRGVVRGERVERSGRFYSAHKFKLEFTPPRRHVPILLAALGPKMAELAGRIGDGIITNMADPMHLERAASSLEAGAKAEGRDASKLEVVTKVRCSVNPDVEKAQAALKRVVAFYGLADYYRNMFSEMGLKSELARLREAYVGSGFKEAVKTLPDEIFKRLPAIIPASSMEEFKSKLRFFDHVKANRIIIAYVPSTEDPTKETAEFVSSW